jgi:hypothetical protein
MFSRYVWIAAILVASFPTAAANLIPNPGFDEPDVSEWTPVMPSYVASAEWSDTDEAGSPASGSLWLKLSGESHVQLPSRMGICVPVVGGRTYVYGGSAFISSAGKVQSIAAQASVLWWLGPHCDVNSAYYDSGVTAVRLRDSWGPIQGSSTAPSIAQSASLAFAVTAETQTGFEVFIDNVFFIEDETCVTTHNALCLNHDRFLVTAEWATAQGAAGYGHGVRITDESGYFWFFNQENVEIVAKLIDACSTQFDSFWFFASGLTDVETRLRVSDTRFRQVERAYINPLHTPFAAIQDTSAFSTCP